MIEHKTVGELIDQLITASVGCWHAQEDIANDKRSYEQRGQDALRAMRLNKRRADLVSAIDRALGQQENETLKKTY